jgi:pimeloyl-ACP methyl ester carboxylesterase
VNRLLLATLLVIACTTKETPMSKNKTGYAPVNGLQLYYEIHGSGDPLIVPHGALGSTQTLVPDLAALARKRQVIAVDLQAHGRTANIDRPLTCQAMADDIGALLTHLDLPKVYVMGYSLGGGVAIQTGVRHRDACASSWSCRSRLRAPRRSCRCSPASTRSARSSPR